MKKWIIYSLTLSLVMLGACQKKKEAAPKLGEISEEMKKSAEEATDKAKNAVAEVTAKGEEGMAELDKKIEELEEKLKAATGDAQEEIQKQIETLKGQKSSMAK